MLQDPSTIPTQGNSPVKKFWRYSSFVLLAAVLYTGWVFYSRWNENRELERKTQEERQAAAQQAARETVGTLGGTSFDILSFYGNPGEIWRGETSQLCYGVSNAKTVELDPPVASMWPSVSRCFDVTPTKTTTYTLTAQDSQGNKKTATLEVKVR